MFYTSIRSFGGYTLVLQTTCLQVFFSRVFDTSGKVLPSWIIMASQPGPPPNVPPLRIAGLSKGLLTILVSLNSMVVSGSHFTGTKNNHWFIRPGIKPPISPNQVLEKCAWCGRTFNPTAMKSHAKSCTQETKKNRWMQKTGCVIQCNWIIWKYGCRDILFQVGEGM